MTTSNEKVRMHFEERKKAEQVEFFMPTREQVNSLSVGDLAPDAFGKLAKVVEISYRGMDVNGRAYVGYCTEFDQTSIMSNSMKEDTLLRHAGLSVQNSAELDDIEREMRLERVKAEPRCGICGQVIPKNEPSAVCEVLIEDVLPDDCESLGCCGTDPEDHEWVATLEVEGGCTENPGVHSLGGTVMSFSSHCKNCGLTKSEKHTGPQRNPGEPEETVGYEWMSDWRERWGY